MRYATTWLGTTWAVLQPLAMVAIYMLVFGFVMRYGREASDARQYALYLLAGLLPYQAIADSLQRSCSCLRQDKSLLERETFPAEVVPLARVISAALPELVGLALLAVATLAWVPAAGFALATLPLLVLLRVVISSGLAWWISVLAVFVTDVTELLAFGLTAWLFLTPVFYAADQLPAALAWTLAINPLHHLITAYREVLLEGRLPWVSGGLSAMWAVFFAGSGLWFFRKSIDRAKDFL